ncbi:MAG: Gfo/Idh/MocA family oxidoreductase, partial [Eubacteriales bacterium]|nr:Gfo/Idh/MocA family oxidoreductase [Eubacteriales bacterium]
MKRIGFIDYFLDEWHANNYPAWIRASSQSDSFEVAYAWAAMDKPGGLTTQQWCERHQVEAMPSLEALVDDSDCLILLSPDNPEEHERLAQLALRSGKPTYIDKMFAPDAAAARRLFDLAERHHTPLYSTSALRYARELS